MNKKWQALFLAITMVAAACGGGDDDDNGGNDTPDASVSIPDANSAPDASSCLALPNYGQLPEVPATNTDLYAEKSANGNVVFGVRYTAQGAAPFAVLLLLRSGATTGSTTITGAEAAFASCKTCLLLAVGPDGAEQWYMANGGTINVTTLGDVGGKLTFSISNPTFTQITAPPAAAPVAGGCTSAFASWSVDTAVMMAAQKPIKAAVEGAAQMFDTSILF